MYDGLPLLSAMAATAGFLSHVLYFIRHEHHKQAVLFVKLFLGFPPVSCLFLMRSMHVNFSQAATVMVSMTAAYLVALWTSMIVYRSFFHRLHHFPGPALAKTSKFYHVSRLGRMDNYQKLAAWHQTYGNVVRIGPAELSIISPNAAIAIYGSGSPCEKSPWYDNNVGQDCPSLQQTRDVDIHESRRRIWDRAFSSKALHNYEDRVIGYTHELITQISAKSGQPINISTWFKFYSFDVMGDLAFGKSFDMLKTGAVHYAISMMERAFLPIGLISPIPWIIPIFAATPIISADFRNFILWCKKQVDLRKTMKVDVPDISSWLIEDGKFDCKWLAGDARLIVVAGSDTTAIAMTYICYHFASDPTQVEKLRAELMPLINPDASINVKDVQHAKHLNGIINETLRMHPPVPSGTQRTTPPEGYTVDGVFIPGGINVIVPHYAIGRSEECYAQPNEFIPERWYSRPGLIKVKNAYLPFSLGRFGCIGKQLALMELRIVISMLVTRFDISFPPGDDGSSLIAGTKDTFTCRLGDLNLVFTKREAGDESV